MGSGRGLAALGPVKGIGLSRGAIVSMHQPWLNEVRDAIASIRNIGVQGLKTFCQRSAKGI